jgi:hypothetical protein
MTVHTAIVRMAAVAAAIVPRVTGPRGAIVVEVAAKAAAVIKVATKLGALHRTIAAAVAANSRAG